MRICRQGLYRIAGGCRFGIMKKITAHASILFAVATIAFGIIQIVAGNFNRGLLPVPDTVPARILFLYTTAVVLIVLGSGLLFAKWRYAAAVLLGIFYGMLFLLVHFFKLAGNIYDPNEWTAAMEVISLCCGAFFIAAMPHQPTGLFSAQHTLVSKITRVARYVFSFSLLVFAFLHFKYADFIAMLIPAWLPFKWWLGVLVGIGFLLAAISIVINKMTELATFLLGCMFLLWVFILHLPRALSKMKDEPEWTSLFVALAFSSISFILSFLSQQHKRVAPNIFMEDDAA